MKNEQKKLKINLQNQKRKNNQQLLMLLILIFFSFLILHHPIVLMIHQLHSTKINHQINYRYNHSTISLLTFMNWLNSKQLMHHCLFFMSIVQRAPSLQPYHTIHQFCNSTYVFLYFDGLFIGRIDKHQKEIKKRLTCFVAKKVWKVNWKIQSKKFSKWTGFVFDWMNLECFLKKMIFVYFHIIFKNILKS